MATDCNEQLVRYCAPVGTIHKTLWDCVLCDTTFLAYLETYCSDKSLSYLKVFDGASKMIKEETQTLPQRHQQAGLPVSLFGLRAQTWAGLWLQ